MQATRGRNLCAMLAGLVTVTGAATAGAAGCPIGPGLCPEMVQVPGGSFTMGSSSGGDPSEQPAHRVALKSFRISKTPVTFEQWDACVNSAGCINGPSVANDLGAGRGQRPVSYVTYVNAIAYTGWLGAQLHTHFRLPSEAEYEYAARAGSSTRYPWGDDADPGKAGTQVDVVGRFPPNAFGLLDMTGTIAEIVTDCWHDRYDGAPADGSSWALACRSGPATGLLLTTRGAELKNDAITDVRSTARQPFGAIQRSALVGFRVVQDD